MQTVTLQAATRDTWPCLDNLMQFYLHDLSQWLPLALAPQGLYPIQALDDYWRDPATRPFLLWVAGELAGFAVVDGQHGNGTGHNLGYLFIARRFRRQGVGRQVVQQLFEALEGPWQVMHFDANQPARQFWSRVLTDLSQHPGRPQSVIAQGHPCTLYRWPGPLPSITP